MALLVIYNANPLERRTGDCVYRALSRFLCVSWREALDSLVRWAADRGLTNFNFRSTYTAFLKERGYERHRAPRKGVTVREFCDLHAEKGKIYILSCPRHLTVAEWPPEDNAEPPIGGCKVIDTWDCRDKVVDGYWVREWTETENGPVTRDGQCAGYI